ELIDTLKSKYERDEKGKICVVFSGKFGELPAIAAYNTESPQDFVVQSIELNEHDTICIKAETMDDREPCTLWAQDVFIGQLRTIMDNL
ncbi:MAG: hypothetical protein IKO56_06985, partial [Alphaproteobacteria bacterium]|nr:hypothetical protein [Alphaproteobacteria bacterium]